MFSMHSILLLALGTPVLGRSPLPPEDVTIKHVADRSGVSISYKRTEICETNARAFAGYVHIPSSELQGIQDPANPYNASIFFWYFEARQDPHSAPTAIYLAGGPGQSSMYGATLDGGPCNVLQDSMTTQENLWSWNNAANMLYVDTPVGVGFSYDSLVNSTLDLLFLGNDPTSTGILPFDAYNGSVPAPNTTFLYGTVPSQDPSHTANSTSIAARMLWHFTQIWFPHFPELKTKIKQISYWGNSYGGYSVASSAAYTLEQNAKIREGKINGTVHDINAVGWTNGCIDVLYQAELYPEMAHNNTYGLEVIDQEAYNQALANYTMSGGCRDQVIQCRQAAQAYDPQNLNINTSVNALCEQAFIFCEINVISPFDEYSNRSDFDIAHLKPDPFPPSYLIGYLNQASVQQALGVPVNFTANALTVYNNFLYQTGDPVRVEGMKALEALLAAGVDVAMIYGDRDYRCNWLGGENLSLQAKWSGTDAFQNAGYAPIRSGSLNETETGVVRQHGSFSFSRIFQAGHDAVVYQPETIYNIFERTISGRDVATGHTKLANCSEGGGYSTKGPRSSLGIRAKLPPAPPVECYLLSVASTCTTEQYLALSNGTAIIRQDIIVEPSGEDVGPITLP